MPDVTSCVFFLQTLTHVSRTASWSRTGLGPPESGGPLDFWGLGRDAFEKNRDAACVADTAGQAGQDSLPALVPSEQGTGSTGSTDKRGLTAKNSFSLSEAVHRRYELETLLKCFCVHFVPEVS